MAKLTLHVEPDIIDAAKTYAQAHHVSLSKLVTHFFRTLMFPPAPDFWRQLHTTLERAGFTKPPDDLDALRQAHVQRQYQ